MDFNLRTSKNDACNNKKDAFVFYYLSFTPRPLEQRRLNAQPQIHVLAQSIAVDETTSVVVLASMNLVRIQAIAH